MRINEFLHATYGSPSKIFATSIILPWNTHSFQNEILRVANSDLSERLF
jgi:hypothetical protein